MPNPSEPCCPQGKTAASLVQAEPHPVRDDFTDAEVIAAVARITGSNFRLVQRLFAQIQRVMDINNLSTITKEVPETARESLVIGACERHSALKIQRHPALKTTTSPP